MGNEIEDVKGILDKYTHQFQPPFDEETGARYTRDDIAEEICQLFEPEPDNEGLLTEGRIKGITGNKIMPFHTLEENSWWFEDTVDKLLKAQRDLTMADRDTERRDRIENLLDKYEAKVSPKEFSAICEFCKALRAKGG